MVRITVRTTESQLRKIRKLVEAGEFPNKSEFLRSAARNELSKYSFENEAIDRINDSEEEITIDVELSEQ